MLATAHLDDLTAHVIGHDERVQDELASPSHASSAPHARMVHQPVNRREEAVLDPIGGCRIIQGDMVRDGYQVVVAFCGNPAFNAFRHSSPDPVVLHSKTPLMDGVDVP